MPLNTVRQSPLVSIRVLVGIVQEPVRRAGAEHGRLVSIRVLVGIAQERAHLRGQQRRPPVSIRVLVGIAQEPSVSVCLPSRQVSFNPCVGRNSSGAHLRQPGQGNGRLFQSVCWSE